MSQHSTAADLVATFDAFNRHDVHAMMIHFADDCVFYTVAGDAVYGGNGVMYSAQAGRRMAQLVVGIIGSATMPISDLFSKEGIKFWDCVHECNAGMSADGFTRATGKRCVILVG